MRSRAVGVLEARAETPTQTTLALDWSPEAAPGQFVMVWLPGVDEVPMGFSRLRPRAAITVQALGEATEALRALVPGARLGVRGPLGHGFTMARKGEVCLLVGGGNGMAPLAALAEDLVAAGAEVHVAIGARTEQELLFERRARSAGCARVEVATDDGTKGLHGFASVLAEGMMETSEPDRVYTCGPEPMMRKVADACWKRGVPFEASLERYMKCGIGVCDSCALGPFLVCRDGPVLDGDRLRCVEDFGVFRRGPSGLREPFGGPKARPVAKGR
jgi:dihydroorotate dehydrogenase electron transfer subunit